MEEGRVKKTLRNTGFSLIYKMSDIILVFILRTIFIHTVGKAYLGLSGLFTNIMTVLSLMELGVGSAIVFSLYKPLATKNDGKVAALMQLYKKMYNTIGILVCLLGLILTPFLKYIINFPENIEYIYIIYWLTVANTAVTYFLAYRRSLLMADQRNDINMKNQILFRFTRFFILAFILIITHNFILYLLLDVINSLVSNIHITYVIKKRYKHIEEASIEPLTKEEKHSIIKYMASGAFSRIGQTVITSTDNIIISAYISTLFVGIYSNYNMVIAGVDTLVYLLFSNITASVGNYAVKAGNRASEKLFEKINLANYIISFVATVCMFSLISPFVSIWAGEDYLLPEITVIVLIINFYITINQNCISNFMGAMGELNYINRYRSFIEGIINIIVSIILVKYTKLGITGVFLGTTACFVFGRMWMDAHTLYKYWFRIPFRDYIKKYVKRCLLCLGTSIICKSVTINLFDIIGLSVFTWLIAVAICLMISGLTVIIIYRKTEEFQYYLQLLKIKEK